MIETDGLNVRLGSRTILHDINLQIKSGEKIAIVGPNGAGKTTLIKTLSGILRYDGHIYLNGKELKNLNKKEVAKTISYVPQVFYTPYSFKVEEFVKMGKYVDFREWWNAENIDEYLKSVGMLDFKERLISTLSGGELQKVMIARALAQEPKIIIMDEPTSHLDPRSIIEINEIINKMNRTVISVVHDVNIAFRSYDRIVIINEGKLFGTYERGSREFLEAISEIYGIRYRITNEGYIIAYDH